MKGPRVVVIGGGAAGLMAAGRAAEKGARVVLVEKNQTLGAKLLLSGKGRCNLTSAEEDLDTFLSPSAPRGSFFIRLFPGSAPLKPWIFPPGDSGQRWNGEKGFSRKGGSERVINCLIDYIRQGGVTVYRNREALNLEIRDGRAVRFILRGQEVEGDAFLICTGGKSFPRTGSTGDGYRFAKRAGHQVLQPVPALCPVRLKDKWPQTARGLNLKNVSLTLLKDGTVVSRRFGELLLTHFGISGPIAMDMSRDIGEAYSTGNAALLLDLKPALPLDVLTARIGRDLEKYAGKMFRDCLKDLLPGGIIPAVVEKATIPPDKKAEYISPEEKNELARLLKEYPLTPDGLLGFDWSIVTSGGVDLKEIDPRTMGSKIVENLYFAGEILDLDGPTGGFNLQMCWSTGFVAGDSAALSACREN